MNSIIDILNSSNEEYDGQAMQGFVQGIVLENNNKEHKGMVKVEFTAWDKENNVCEWVRLLTPYGGDTHGVYAVPEVDDVVLVGFIGGSLKRPFVLGCLYPAGAKMISENFDDKNNIKQIKTRTGITITFQEEDNKQQILVTTPKGSQLQIEDEKETCLISDKGGKNKLLMDFKNGAIALEAEKKMSLKVGSVEVVLDGNAGSCSVKAKDVKIEANSGLTAKSSNQVQISGMTVDVKANQQLNLKGSMQTAVSGGIVKIN